MKAKTTLPSLGVLAVAALLAANPVQACLPFFSTGPDQAACATGQIQAGGRSCAVPGQPCGPINQDLMVAVGDLAAGGMQFAAHMMRALAEEVGRLAALGAGER